MTERENLAQIIESAGVDLTEDGVGSTEENSLRIADALLAARWGQGPGAPASDELARNAARNAMADVLRRDCRAVEDLRAGEAMPDGIADVLLGHHVATWERDVTASGVPVRRYVLRGEWEVDPEGPKPYRPKHGDVVEFDGGEWIVGSVPFPDRPNPGATLVLLRRPDWDKRHFISTVARELTFIRRGAS